MQQAYNCCPASTLTKRPWCAREPSARQPFVLLPEAKSSPSSAITRLKKQPAATAMGLKVSGGSMMMKKSIGHGGVDFCAHANGAAQGFFSGGTENKLKKMIVNI